MSGHNKWSKIKHKKAATDAKKSKEFGKLVRDIKVAVKEADGNADSPAVQLAIDRAKQANMPKDNIERAIKSAQGVGGADLSSALYEAYGPGGVALLIETMTDNTNRTSAEIKKILSKHSTDLAAPGSATWAFSFTNGAWTPQQTVPLTSDAEREALKDLCSDLEEHEEVGRVVTNIA